MKVTVNKSEAAIMRAKAEMLLKKKSLKTSPQPPEVETLKLIHELEVHQIELELQNEELRHAWAMTEAANDKYTGLYDFAPSGYFTLSKEGKIIELNRCGSIMLGKERTHLINSQFGFFVSNDTKPIFNLFLKNVFTSKAKESCEVTVSIADNLPMYVHITGIVMENGEQCLVTLVDITERELAEVEIKHKNEELLKLNAEKDKFFSIIAHDLRSPFNVFLGFTRIMAEDLSSLKLEEIQEIALEMRDSAANLYRLLENLLEWSCIQRGITDFDPKLFLLMPNIAESMQSVMESANKKGIEIGFKIPEDLLVFADVNMLGSTIRNIASNAVKFTFKGGKITLAAKSVADNSVEISITDTGIGMNKDMLDKLFLFDGHTNRKGTENELSTGLGLIICKDFIEKHGGKIWAKSEEGKGSTFYFTIPYITEL
jgi:signal transduction histidine kinase